MVWLVASLPESIAMRLRSMREPQVHGEGLRGVVAVAHVERRDREGAFVARAGGVIGELDGQIAALHRSIGIRLWASTSNMPPCRLKRSIARSRMLSSVLRLLWRLTFGSGMLVRPSGADHQVDVRLGDVEREDIDIGLDERDQLEPHRDRGRAEERRLIRRLGAVQHELLDLGGEASAVETEAADFHASAGGGLHCGDDAAAHLVEKPFAFQREIRPDEQHQPAAPRERRRTAGECARRRLNCSASSCTMTSVRRRTSRSH